MTDDRVLYRKSILNVRFLLAAVALAGPCVVSTADASPRRTLCAAGALVNNTLPRDDFYWQAWDQCQVRTQGTVAWSSSSALYGSISFPLQTGSTSVTNVTPRLRAYGGNGASSSAPRLDACAYTFDGSGNFAASTTIEGTTGSTATHQGLLSSNSLYIPAGGAYTVNFAAQKGAGVDLAAVSWSSSAVENP